MSSATSLPFGVNDTAVRTTLSSGITSTDTSIDVGEVTNPPSLPFLIAVFVDQSPLREDDMEIMEVTSISGTTLTVNRGAKGTPPKSFSTGDKVFVGIVPSDAFDQVGASRSEIQFAAGTREIQQSLNELAFSIAESQFNQNLTRLDYDGGLFHVFEDTRDVAGNTSSLSFNGSVGPFKGDLQTTPTTLTDSTDSVRGVAFGPNGRLATGAGYSDTNTYIYDSNLNLINTLTDATGRVYAVAFDSNGRLAVGSDDNNVYVYDSNLNLTNTLTDAGRDVFAVSFSPNGRLAVGSRDENTYIYDSNLNLTNTLTDATDSVRGVAFGPNGRLATGSQDNNAYVYDSNLNLTNTITDTTDNTEAASFASDGRLALGSFRYTYVYDSNLNLINTLRDPSDTTLSVSFSPNGRLAVGSGDTNTYIYDSNLNLTKTLTDPKGRVYGVAFDPIGRLAVGPRDEPTYVYDSNNATTIFVSFSDLDLSAHGFSSPPADAVVAHNFTPDTDGSHAIEYTVSDQSGNSVLISESQVGDIVDVSSLQDTTLSVQVDVTDIDLNASLDAFAIHFNE